MRGRLLETPVKIDVVLERTKFARSVCLSVSVFVSLCPSFRIENRKKDVERVGGGGVEENEGAGVDGVEGLVGSGVYID